MDGAVEKRGAEAGTIAGKGLNAGSLLNGRQRRAAMEKSTWAWILGSVWLTAVAGVPYTNFAKALHASEFQFGVLAALPFIASLLSLPARLGTEATGKRKKIFLWGQYFQRGMWLPIAVVPWVMVKWYGGGVASAAMAVFLGLVFVMHCGAAVGGPGWLSWMTDIVPERVRGKYFARR